MDECDASNLDSPIAIGECRTDVTNYLFPDGCTMSDFIGNCAADSSEHQRDFVRCVRELARQWRRDGLISPRQRAQIVHCAAKATVP